MDKLCPAKHITMENFSGNLFIYGDLRENCFLIRFVFDQPEAVQPLLVWIKAIPIGLLRKGGRKKRGQGTKMIIMECNIPDFNNPGIMKSRLIYPEFLLRESMIRVTSVEAQVSCQISAKRDIDK